MLVQRYRRLVFLGLFFCLGSVANAATFDAYIAPNFFFLSPLTGDDFQVDGTVDNTLTTEEADVVTGLAIEFSRIEKYFGLEFGYGQSSIRKAGFFKIKGHYYWNLSEDMHLIFGLNVGGIFWNRKGSSTEPKMWEPFLEPNVKITYELTKDIGLYASGGLMISPQRFYAEGSPDGNNPDGPVTPNVSYPEDDELRMRLHLSFGIMFNIF